MPINCKILTSNIIFFVGLLIRNILLYFRAYFLFYQKISKSFCAFIGKGFVFILLINCPIQAQQKKPNVLFIMVDDLRPQLGCYGVPLAQTPNIDKLAQNGIRFNRAYAQQAVCGPSRASLLTGKRPATTKIIENNEHFRLYIPNTVTLPQYFKQNGYFTQSVGKIYHTNLDDPMSWSVPSWMPPVVRYGKPETLEYLRIENEKQKAAGKEFREVQEFDPQTGTPLRVVQYNSEVKGPSWEDPDVADSVLRDGKTALKALETLDKLAKQDAPFFLAVGFSNPHLPFTAPKKYFDLYPKDKISLPANIEAPKNAPKVALEGVTEWHRYKDLTSKKIDSTKALELIRAYYAATSYSDAMIGLIMNKLEELKLKENTIIVLLGDHGYHLGEQGLWTKHTNFENGTRTPLIFSYAGFKNKGKSTDNIAELIDIYPTLCDLAGLQKPKDLEGVSLIKSILKPNSKSKAVAYSQFHRNKKTVMGYSVRTADFRYTEWVDMATKQVLETELYDHKIDMAETKNVTNERKYVAMKNKGKALINVLKKW